MSEPAAPDVPQQLLRRAGLRVTKPRLAVLTALAAHPRSGRHTVLDVAEVTSWGLSPDRQTHRPAATLKE